MKTKYILPGFLVPVITARSFIILKIILPEGLSYWLPSTSITVRVSVLLVLLVSTLVPEISQDVLGSSMDMLGDWCSSSLSGCCGELKVKQTETDCSQQFKDDMYHGECYHYHPVCYCT